jgi:pyruvate dehydrogenase E1 component alpha subunit
MSPPADELLPAIVDHMHQIITPEGQVVGALPDIPNQQLLQFYRWMLFGRVTSNRMVALQRQGRLGTFAELNGQEGAAVGMTAPLQQKDWLLGSYREFLCYHIKGVPLFSQLKQWGGDIADDYPREVGCLPFQIVLGTQVLHAVGLAQAIKYQKETHVALVGCGDGATSEGDFNEALNFAGVYQAPVIFVVQNNGWAISTPRRSQTAARHLADRGQGFGVPACLVDGNDVLAVYQVVSEAVARARAGDGPTLIEAITYRLGAHTTADDPTRYRPQDELEQWAKRDPITRFRTFLRDRHILTESEDKHIFAEIDAEFDEALAAYEALPPRTPHQHFEYIFADLTPQLREQRARLLQELEIESDKELDDAKLDHGTSN